MSQAVNSQAHAATAQAQAMTIQANQEIIPRAHQKVATMTSHLRDLTQMNPLTFYGSKVKEDRTTINNNLNHITYTRQFETSITKFKLEMCSY